MCCVCLTLDAPFEERLAALARPDAVVVARGVVVAHGAVVEVDLPARRDHALLAVLGPPPSTLTNRQVPLVATRSRLLSANSNCFEIGSPRVSF